MKIRTCRFCKLCSLPSHPEPPSRWFHLSVESLIVAREPQLRRTRCLPSHRCSRWHRCPGQWHSPQLQIAFWKIAAARSAAQKWNLISDIFFYLFSLFSFCVIKMYVQQSRPILPKQLQRNAACWEYAAWAMLTDLRNSRATTAAIALSSRPPAPIVTRETVIFTNKYFVIHLAQFS